MSLFGDLPPPSAHLRPKVEEPNLQDEYKPAPAEIKSEPLHAEDEEYGDEERPAKRQRPEERDSPEPPRLDDQVTAALHKIGSHISNPDKFSKASGLLRQLLDSGALTRGHRDILFDVTKKAFSDFDNTSEASLRRDYMKLCHALDKRSDLFTRAQRSQLEVYRVLGFVQNEMHTDDSFIFNKVLGRIKEAVQTLSPASEEDEAALAEVQAGSDSDSGSDGEGPGRQAGDRPTSRWADADSQQPRIKPEPQPTIKQEKQGDAPAHSAQPPPAPADDDDPFGLNSLLPPPKPAPPPPPPPAPDAAAGRGGKQRVGRAWTAAQALAMRRQALVECLITARGFHKTTWARTSVELMVEHYSKHRDRFTSDQQVAVDEMVKFVRQARLARPTGPSQREINRDSTSFERATSEWSRVKLSARGKVGSQGDAKSQNWLG